MKTYCIITLAIIAIILAGFSAWESNQLSKYQRFALKVATDNGGHLDSYKSDAFHMLNEDL